MAAHSGPEHLKASKTPNYRRETTRCAMEVTSESEIGFCNAETLSNWRDKVERRRSAALKIAFVGPNGAKHDSPGRSQAKPWGPVEYHAQITSIPNGASPMRGES